MLEEARLSARAHALYGKLHVSREDIGTARLCAAYIQEKGWHTWPFTRRGSVYIQQIAFTTAMIVAYCGPFAPGRGNISLPEKLLRFSPQEADLH
jgi:hypothetical protein